MDRFDPIENSALLPQEILVVTASQVGLYLGNERLLKYDNGKLMLTNHRIIWEEDSSTIKKILSLSLSLISGQKFSAQFLQSHAKIELKLLPKDRTADSYLQKMFERFPSLVTAEERWKCDICEYVDNRFFHEKCRECGVPRPENKCKFWSCSQCTFHNDLETGICKMCGYHRTASFSAELPKVKFSFRGQGAKSFFEKLDGAIQSREWQTTSSIDTSSSSNTSGITGLLKKVDLEAQAQSIALNDAFTDMDKLMTSASDLVKLAESMSAKVAKDEQNSYKSLLTSIGIDNPVSRDVYGDQFHENLSKQIEEFLISLIQKNRKHEILPLLDLYCIYNRARGSSLVSPADILMGCKLMGNKSTKFKVHSFPSGVIAVISASYDESEVLLRICSTLEKSQSISFLEWSQIEDVPLAISEEQIKMAEERLVLARDESISGLRFYRNKFMEF